MTTDSKDTGKTSMTKHVPRPPRLPPEEIRYAPPSHPMFSGQIEVRFGKKSRASTGDGEEPRSALEDMMSLSPQEIKEIVDLVLSETDAAEEAPNRTIVSWIQDCITALRDPKKSLQKLLNRE
jgi:hypothetical protein